MKKSKRNKILSFVTLISEILMICGAGYLVYTVSLLNNIENFWRLVLSIVLVLICLLLFILGKRYLNKNKKAKNIVIIILMLLIGGASFFVATYVNKIYGTITAISDTDGYKTYSSSLVTLKDNKSSDIDDIGSSKIGILDDKTSIEGYTIPNEVIKEKKLKNETEKYDSYISMIDDLYDGKIDYVFLPTNYSVMFGSMEGYEDIKDKTKILFTQTKKVKEKSSSNTSKKITEPFTILLMGVDSEAEGIKNSSFNGDSLMLLTFNPKTLSTTILSIPRDSYVPIACFSGNRKNKITHAAWKGENCMMDTISNFLDVDIDYYVKINFKGVVSLVDNLGGVDIDVPYALCEQDSNRRWGNNTVYIEEGKQTLNGEQALAYARNRHANPGMCPKKYTNYTSSDFVRGEHQQEIVTALLEKVKNINSLDTVNKLLDTISNNMTTNMSTDQILSLYNVFKDAMNKAGGGSITDALGMQRLHLNGYDARIVDYGGTNLSLYNYVLYDNSVKAVSDAMKENLGKKKVKVEKSFSFDINKPYEEEVIGQNVTGKKSLVQVPNFVGKSTSYARSVASQYGISVSVSGGEGTVVKQSVPAGANVEDAKSIVLTTGGAAASNKKTDTNSNKVNGNSSSNKTPSSGNSNSNTSGSGSQGGGQPSGSGAGGSEGDNDHNDNGSQPNGGGDGDSTTNNNE